MRMIVETFEQFTGCLDHVSYLAAWNRVQDEYLVYNIFRIGRNI